MILFSRWTFELINLPCGHFNWLLQSFSKRDEPPLVETLHFIDVLEDKVAAYFETSAYFIPNLHTRKLAHAIKLSHT